MKQIRKRVTYANVMSSLAVFLVLGGATAIAAGLGKNSVGTKQLKRNAVSTAKIKRNAITTAKIKNNAITTAKIKNNAVNGNKVKNGSLTGTDINAASTPFTQIVHKASGNTPLALTGSLQQFALNDATYTQLAGEDDQFLGALDVTFQSTCTQPRNVTVAVQLDTANPAVLNPPDIISFGSVSDTGSGTVTSRAEVGPWTGLGAGTRFEPTSNQNHTISMLASGNCTSGSGITATFGGVDVLGTK